MEKSQDVKERLLDAAKREFAEKGFKDASLREISKAADVTTGALYVYFKSKEELFSELVSPVADTALKKLKESGNDFFKESFDRQMYEMFGGGPDREETILDYIYDNAEIFNIALTKSAGTKYENILNSFVEIEEDLTLKMFEICKANGIDIVEISPFSVHILISANFTALFEPLVHGLKKEEAKKRIAEMRRFFNAGWKVLLTGK